KQTNYYKNQFIDVLKFSDDNFPDNLEIVNLGSNQPKYAFDYSETGVQGMNWAIGPQSFEYDLRVLMKYHWHLRDQAIVVIPVCPFNFFLLRYFNDSANYKYYKLLQPEQINNYSSLTKLLHIDYPVLTAKCNILRIIRDVPADKRMEIKTNSMSENELIKDAEKWITGWLKQFQLDGLSDILLSEENRNNIEKNVEILREMIDFCLKNNYRPVITMLPVTKTLSDLFPESFIEKYILGNIQKANIKKIPIFNYLKDERFFSTDLYINSFFFNENGRKYFTNTFLGEISVY
ncbi:MAG: hypothetical protein LBR17_00750, partial [Bacteroidales bacterium]|nr:hypothetical protein [Bacteroidales bacterium]